jgi:ABC-type multidrug transport system fused ATPase/permease subunit
MRHIPGLRGRLRDAILISLGLAVCIAGTPYVFKRVVDLLVTGAQGAPLEQIGAACAVIVLLRLGVVGLEGWQKLNADRFWNAAVLSLRRQVFDAVVNGDVDEHERRPVGETSERFRNIIPVGLWLHGIASGVLTSAVTIAISIIILMVRAPACGLIVLMIVPLSLGISTHAVHRTRWLRRRWYRISSRLGAVLTEIAGQLALVRASGGEPLYRRRFERMQTRWLLSHHFEQSYERRIELLRGLVHAAGFLATALIILASAWLGRATAGDVLLVFALTQAVLAQLQPVALSLNGLGDANAAANTFSELLGTEEPLLGVSPDRIRSVEFRQVGFTYPGERRPVLRGISFKVEAGCRLLIAGPSGSGKSTIVKLLLGIHSPTEGEILINGVALETGGMTAYREQVGAVLQEVLLANTTVFENIRFGAMVTSADVRAAARSAGAEDFIAASPNGYLTQVGERGLKLSGGERQRLIISRAVVRKPAILILDEATSALDAETERGVSAALEAVSREAVTVLISHRPVPPLPGDVSLRLSRINGPRHRDQGSNPRATQC